MLAYEFAVLLCHSLIEYCRVSRYAPILIASLISWTAFLDMFKNAGSVSEVVRGHQLTDELRGH
jgi:hypothetical protein